MSVFLGIPSYGGRVHEHIVTAVVKATKKGLLSQLKIQSFSILTKNFNMLYAAALNARKQGVTHFCMLHEDIQPEDFWLDKMMEISNKYDAGILSAVSPIKDKRGLTSTAIETDDYWNPRRLTMHEIYSEYEPTFTCAKLMVNTGLMLVDIRYSWAERLWFGFNDQILEDEHGEFKAQNVSEDWHFSRMARDCGARVYATREVALMHYGQSMYTNAQAWGTMKRDE